MTVPRIRIIRDGIVVVMDAFVISFFVNESHQLLVGKVENALGIYANFVGLKALPYRLDEDGEIVDINVHSVKELQYEVFHRYPDEDNSVVRIIGAIDDQTGYGFKYMADDLPDPQNPGLRNLISLWLPSELCLELGWESIYKFSRDIAAILPYSYGYGSPCLTYGHNIKYAIGPAKRYPGFDIAFGEACRVDIDEKALGAYWLNFFGEVLCRSLGGIDKLVSKLNRPIVVEKNDDKKLIIRLGSEPQVGDINRRVDLPLYRELSEVIESQLHVPRSIYFPDESGMRDERGMIAWHKRFLKSG